MQNGDRFTCEIKGLDAGVLYVSIEYVDGTISVDWTKVAHLESRQTFIVKDENGFAYTGVLNSTKETARPITLDVAEPGGQSVELRADRVVKLGETSDRFWHRFNGYTSLGFIFTKGNETSQLNISSETEYLREQWAAHAFYNSSLSAASGEAVSTRNQIDFDAFRRLPRENYFYGGRVDFLQSGEEQIKLQTSVGVGLGRFLRLEPIQNLNPRRPCVAEFFVQPAGLDDRTEPGCSDDCAGRQNLSLQQNEFAVHVQRFPRDFQRRSGPCSFQHQRVLLRQVDRRLIVDGFVFWQLGQPTPA